MVSWGVSVYLPTESSIVFPDLLGHIRAASTRRGVLHFTDGNHLRPSHLLVPLLFPYRSRHLNLWHVVKAGSRLASVDTRWMGGKTAWRHTMDSTAVQPVHHLPV